MSMFKWLKNLFNVSRRSDVLDRIKLAAEVMAATDLLSYKLMGLDRDGTQYPIPINSAKRTENHDDCVIVFEGRFRAQKPLTMLGVQFRSPSGELIAYRAYKKPSSMYTDELLELTYTFSCSLP